MLAIGAIITIYLCLILGWQDSITLAIITLILIGDAPADDFFPLSSIECSVFYWDCLLLLPKYYYASQTYPSALEKVEELRHAFEEFYHRCVDVYYQYISTK